MKIWNKIKSNKKVKKYGLWIIIFFIVKGTITSLLGVGLIAWIVQNCS